MGLHADGADHMMRMFSTLNDDEFDMAYAKTMVQDHKKAVSMFSKQAQKGASPELEQFAAKALSVLQEHLKMAQSLPGAKSSAKKKK